MLAREYNILDSDIQVIMMCHNLGVQWRIGLDGVLNISTEVKLLD